MIITVLKQIKNVWRYIDNGIRINRLKMRGAEIGYNVVISKGAKIDNPKHLKIGDNVYIGTDFYANCLGGLTISNGTIISNHCTIMTWNHNYKDNIIRPYGLEYILKPVIINEQVWIGINVSICPGVSIGKQSIIGMGTTVSKNVDSGKIYAGNKVISDREIISDFPIELLELRTTFNPINYILFTVRIKKVGKKKEIPISEIKKFYDKPDTLCMMYRYSVEHNYDIDFQSRSLIRKEKNK